MHDEAGRYTLRGGKWGYDRLLLLARNRWPDTEALFHRAGVAAGQRCIDVGCGGGEVSLELARLVGPGGSVVGIDMDSVKLELGTAAARSRGLSNVEFRRMLVQDWDEPDSYDVCYSRFLLQHLAQPRELLEKMWASVRPGGRLLVEDVDWEGWSSDPPDAGVQFLRERYIRLLERRGGDARIGLRLFRLGLALGIPDPEVAVRESLHVRDEGKLLAPLTLEAIGEALLAEGIARPEELASAQSSLEAIARDPDSLLTGPKIFQLLARKPRVGE